GAALDDWLPGLTGQCLCLLFFLRYCHGGYRQRIGQSNSGAVALFLCALSYSLQKNVWEPGTGVKTYCTPVGHLYGIAVFDQHGQKQQGSIYDWLYFDRVCLWPRTAP